MTPREKWANLTTLEDFDREISLRRNLMGQMVGWLYPSVLQDEIHDLKEKRDEASALHNLQVHAARAPH